MFQNIDTNFMDILGYYEKPFRAALVPSVLWDRLDRYVNDSKGISNYLKQFRTTVKFVPNTLFKGNQYVPIGGFYYDDPPHCELDVYSNNFDLHEFNEISWNRFKFKLIQTLCHEMIHMRQYISRGGETNPRKNVKHSKTGKVNTDNALEYYSERDEIEAYSHCILLDYYYFSPSGMDLGSYLQKDKSPTLKGIRKVFKDDTENKVVPLIMKTVLRWNRRYQQERSNELCEL